MADSGERRSGPLGAFVDLVEVLVFLSFFVVAFVSFVSATTSRDDQFPWAPVLALLLVPVGLYLVLIIHELGHALAVVLTGRRLRGISIGGGSRIVGVRVLGVDLELNGGAPSGFTRYEPGGSRATNALVVAAGPAANAVLVAWAVVAYDPGLAPVHLVVGGLSALTLVRSLVPVRSRLTVDGPGRASDGAQLIEFVSPGRARRRYERDFGDLVERAHDQAGAGDPREVLTLADRLAVADHEEAPLQAALLRAVALEALGEYDASARQIEAAGGGTDDFSDQVLTAMLLGQRAFNAVELDTMMAAVEVQLAELASAPEAVSDAVIHRAAVGRLLQGRPADAVELLRGFRLSRLTTVQRIGVLGTRGLAHAALGDDEAVTQIQAELRFVTSELRPRVRETVWSKALDSARDRTRRTDA